MKKCSVFRTIYVYKKSYSQLSLSRRPFFSLWSALKKSKNKKILNKSRVNLSRDSKKNCVELPITRFELVIFALQVRRLANLAKQANFTKVRLYYFFKFRWFYKLFNKWKCNKSLNLSILVGISMQCACVFQYMSILWYHLVDFNLWKVTRKH